MNCSENQIGIFDSGVGGLSVLKAINTLMPNENLIYVADSQFVPYGSKTVEQIERRALTVAEHLIQQKVKAIVVACNTATAAAVVALRSKYTIPIIGLEPAIKPAIAESKLKRIGVLATEATLNSQKYIDLKTQYGQGIDLRKASPLFVELVETAPQLESVHSMQIEEELKELRNSNIDSLVLGCTHYPFLTQVISEIMGEKVNLFDSGQPVAKELKRCIIEHQNEHNTLGKISYYSNVSEKTQVTFNALMAESVELQPW